MEEKTQINDIDRSIYDIKDEEKDAYRIQAGLTPEIVEKISKEKHDPAWMELFRLQSLQIYNEMRLSVWEVLTVLLLWQRIKTAGFLWVLF